MLLGPFVDLRDPSLGDLASTVRDHSDRFQSRKDHRCIEEDFPMVEESCKFQSWNSGFPCQAGACGFTFAVFDGHYSFS